MADKATDKTAANVDKTLDEIQKIADQEQAQGFRGVQVDPIPNEEYSLQSGPESPSLADQRASAAKAEADQAEQEAKRNA